MEHKKVFVVEDNFDIGYILNTFLDEEGFKTSVFTTISDFYKVYEKELPDIFLLDVSLPDGNGIELCRKLKHESRSLNIPIIIMSAHAPNEKLALEDCADGYISKPFDLDAVLQNIKNILN